MTVSPLLASPEHLTVAGLDGADCIDVRGLEDARVSGVDQLYVVGDIHGRLDLLSQLEEAIDRDSAASLGLRSAICYVGDYIDRGPDSRGVVDFLLGRLSDPIPRVFLCGNHEDRLLAFLDAPAENGPSWMQFGGDTAMQSYGIEVPGQTGEVSWDDLRDRFRLALPAEHLAFYRALRPGLAWRGFLVVHAGIRPDRALAAQQLHDLMWIREPFTSSTADHGVKVVHGHVISAEPELNPNRIGIDTGAYRSGRLTALAIAPDGLRFLQTGRDFEEETESVQARRFTRDAGAVQHEF